ncbi:MAG: LptF/LptG family permease [Alphaproteobacteria bacterium]
MKIYFRYIAKNLFINISIIAIILIAIIWLTQSLRYINLIVNSGINFFSFLKLSCLLIPSLAYLIIPIATYIGIVYFYNKLLMERELVILKTVGMDKYNIYKPAIFCSIIFLIMNLFLSLFLMPFCSKEFKSKLIHYRNNYGNIILEEGVFNNKIKGLTIYVEKQIEPGLMSNVVIHDKREAGKEITIMAEYGKLNLSKASIEINFINGNKQEIDKNRKFSILYFENFAYNLGGENINSNKWSLEPNEQYIHELINNYKISKSPSPKVFNEIHQRLTWPIYNLIMALLAVILVEIYAQNPKNIKRKHLTFIILPTVSIILYFMLFNIVIKYEILIALIYIKIALFFYGARNLLGPKRKEIQCLKIFVKN